MKKVFLASLMTFSLVGSIGRAADDDTTQYLHDEFKKTVATVHKITHNSEISIKHNLLGMTQNALASVLLACEGLGNVKGYKNYCVKEVKNLLQNVQNSFQIGTLNTEEKDFLVQALIDGQREVLNLGKNEKPKYFETSNNSIGKVGEEFRDGISYILSLQRGKKAELTSEEVQFLIAGQRDLFVLKLLKLQGQAKIDNTKFSAKKEMAKVLAAVEDSLQIGTINQAERDLLVEIISSAFNGLTEGMAHGVER